MIRAIRNRIGASHCIPSWWKFAVSVSTLAAAATTFIVLLSSSSQGDDDFEHPPISYHTSQSHDSVAQLMDRLKAGTEKLAADSNGSYLKSLLSSLKIPESSQCLVFSKTSLQIPYIGPRTPRAIYFNDSAYVGSVIGSTITELTAVDPQLGPVFYTLERDQKDYQIIRDRGQCLSCHATSRTERVPGVIVRSIYSDKAGRPRSGSSTYITDHRSPFEQRWGGWYVTGEHGSMRHLGNIFALDRLDPAFRQLVDDIYGLMTRRPVPSLRAVAAAQPSANRLIQPLGREAAPHPAS